MYLKKKTNSKLLTIYIKWAVENEVFYQVTDEKGWKPAVDKADTHHTSL